MKILKWIVNNLLFGFTIFLLIFIPLYPKIPLLDVEHTWVYIRLEDFAVALVVLIWAALLLLKKVTLKSPLTIPILVFWIIGGLTTLHGVLILFPTLSDVFSNVALLSFLRRVEYMSLFFIAFSSIKDKKLISYVGISLMITLLLIVGYGLGQKYYRFPAYLTMNEEFAKGVPIQLSELSRVPSTFAGHYDLAAYLVLVIPILASLFFGFKNIILKIFLLISVGLGFVLLSMTVSRVSFFVLLFSMLMLLIFQRKKLIILFLLILTFGLLLFSPSLLDRFKGTVSEVNVLVDARTGGAIGQVKEVPPEYFEGKIVKKVPIPDEDVENASDSAVLPFELIPEKAPLVIEANSPTGENLPQGTSYVNLPLSPVIRKVDGYFFEKLKIKDGVESNEVSIFYGDFLIKKAKAYDLSFTTRFQGEWPNTIEAFKRNIFLGSGYGSVSLAVDNNYLRILGESGIFGLLAFISIFIVAVIYMRKILPSIESNIVKSFIIGFVAGSFGLALNAILIDVFEASKVAFTYWLLMGIVIGALHLYKRDEINILNEFKKAIISPIAVVGYIFIAVMSFYFSASNYYFVGDDFTWFKWISDCCTNPLNYFLDSNGFFYRPGTKIYFSLMHSVFWLNQTMYHFVSIFLHFAVSVILFLILKKISKDYILSIVGVSLFIVLSGHHEAIFWISSTGFLFNALFILLSLWFFINWRENKKIIYISLSLVFISLSLLFHELGVIAPILLILYDIIFGDKLSISYPKKIFYFILFIPIIPYLILRFLANSHWFSGDYSYNIIKLPFNIVGNTFGYLLLDLLGTQSISIYQGLRNLSRDNIFLGIVFVLIGTLSIIFAYKIIWKRIAKEDQKIVIFGILFFLIALLPFLGLGNITSRYSYLSSAGFVVILAFILKKTYGYLISISDKYIGTACIIVISIAFLMFQTFNLQKIHSDWRRAGDTSRKFLISIEEYSKDFWLRDRLQFYFVNIPLKRGEAWVWPVGLKDALWFTFKNPNLSVFTLNDVDLALDQAGSSPAAHVFRFDEDGNVEEIRRTKDGRIVTVNPPRQAR